MADEKKAEPRPALCPKCNTSAQVGPLTMSGVYDDVQYWRCESCGRVWATRYAIPINPSYAGS
jgi:transposase-like protein